MKKEVLKHNSKMIEVCLKELDDYLKTKEKNKDEKIVKNKKAIKGIRKYRLGYDFLFLPNRTFKYKGELIGGTSITVLFKVYDIDGNEILFETEGEELKEQTIKLKNGEECYLCDLFYCSFDKEKFKEDQTFDFSPTMNVIMSNCRIAMEIHSYTKDIEVRKVIFEPENIDRKEFNDIILNNLERFDVTDNKPAQSCAYIAIEVTEEV
ncbi:MULTISPECIES: hypothetical protein [Clostridium]|uniref:Uncharacterized protein n=1 Tax=Clostridium perfringens TaxID=1502 RepID=A0A133MM03_CLOPF|nr:MULTISPECIES: hypothetical protein [Clostridium]KXA05067.1 hypothetical protein HMPREF3222_03135 [Clostridium perfringens]MDU5108705.1 hypothetical protein [Clostridium sp.]